MPVPSPSPSCENGKDDDNCRPEALVGCPADIRGDYEFPHLIVPVDKQYPDKAYGNKLNGTFSDNICSIFNFDIHPRFAGKTCTLVFLFPDQKDLETSAYTYKAHSDEPSLEIYKLKKQAS
jgi:hypothetical protein